MATAAILGLDTAAGAYLARLLGARGYTVRGTGDAALLEPLGVAGDVTLTGSLLDAIEGASEIYDLRNDATVPVARGRIVVAVAPRDTRRRAAAAAARADGTFVATAILYPHESRLGPGATPVARIVAAAAAGIDADPADLESNGDCGWTPEYVDALWRLLQRPAAAEIAVATGRLLSGIDAARAAAAYFGRPPPPQVGVIAASPGDPAAAQTALGWRAVTWGRDLVDVLCEGAAC